MPADPSVSLTLAQDKDADALLSRDPFSLLVGMLLDQQYAMEHAFRGPWKIASRLEMKTLDPGRIAAFEPAAFTAICSQVPAIHRYPGSMSGRVQQLAAHIEKEYAGSAANIWAGVKTGDELLGRLKKLPGFGEQKAKIFLALLGKQLGVRPKGWREAAGSYGDNGSRRSIADVTSPKTLEEVRTFKQEMKAAAKGAAPAKPAPAKPAAARPAKKVAAKPAAKAAPKSK